jgi:hypothetical protein
MLTSAKIGKQNGDTRTRKTEPGYLNLSIVFLSHVFVPSVKQCFFTVDKFLVFPYLLPSSAF